MQVSRFSFFSFLLPGELPATTGLKEGEGGPRIKPPRQIQIYSIQRLHSSAAIRVKNITKILHEKAGSRKPGVASYFDISTRRVPR